MLQVRHFTLFKLFSREVREAPPLLSFPHWHVLEDGGGFVLFWNFCKDVDELIAVGLNAWGFGTRLTRFCECSMLNTRCLGSRGMELWVDLQRMRFGNTWRNFI